MTSALRESSKCIPHIYFDWGTWWVRCAFPPNRKLDFAASQFADRLQLARSSKENKPRPLDSLSPTCYHAFTGLGKVPV